MHGEEPFMFGIASPVVFFLFSFFMGLIIKGDLYSKKYSKLLGQDYKQYIDPSM